MITIALSAFKNYASGEYLGSMLRKGIQENNRHKIKVLSMADGGEGSIKRMINDYQGKIKKFKADNALGDHVEADIGSYMYNGNSINIIETCQTAGFGYNTPTRYNTLTASSYGTGHLIRASLKNSPESLLIGLGGSIVSDGGIGAGYALGAKYFDYSGNELDMRKNGYSCIDINNIERISISGIKNYSNTEIIVLSDVSTPLLGKKGQAISFGPQKGANKSDIKSIEIALTHWRDLLLKAYNIDFNTEFSGAAGGMASGFAALLGARLVSGSEYIYKNSKISKEIKCSDYVIVGEGKLDKTSLLNKGSIFLTEKARSLGKKVIGVFGNIEIEKEIMSSQFDYIIDLSKIADQNNIDQNYFLNKSNFEIFNLAGKEIADFINDNKRV